MLNSSAADDQFLEKLSRIIQDKMTDSQFGVSDLAREMGMSRSNLHRKVSDITGKTVVALLSEARLKRAMELLKEGTYTVSEVSWRAGFGSVTYFNKCFHDFYGFPPGEAGKRDFQKIPPGADQNPEIHADNRKKRTKIILGIVSFVVLSILILVFIRVIPVTSDRKNNPVTIAVLPFNDNSPEEGNGYIIDGLVEEIIDKLFQLGKFQIAEYSTVSKYKESGKPPAKIARELMVQYLITGNAQKIGKKIRINLQLVDGSTGKYLWRDSYMRDILPADIENVFSIQEEVATNIVSKLSDRITPEEKKQIERKPTQNLAAYNKYQHGNDFLRIAANAENWGKKENEQAKSCFEQAVELDSTFAEAYGQLGHIYINKLYYRGDMYLADRYLDSGLVFLNKALHFSDGNLPGIKVYKYQYYLKKGMVEEARNFKSQLPQRVENISSYAAEITELSFFHDYYNSLNDFYKYLKLKPDDEPVPDYLLQTAGRYLLHSGYPEQARYYFNEILLRNNDSTVFFESLRDIEFYQYHLEAARQFAFKIDHKNPLGYFGPAYSLMCYTGTRDYKKAYEWYLLMTENTKKTEFFSPLGVFTAYVLLMNGKNSEADKDFRKVIKIMEDEIKLNARNAQELHSYFFLASTWSALGQPEKALEYLKLMLKFESCPQRIVIWLDNFPMFDNIRQNPEFKKVFNELEAKYQKTHLQVGELLKEQGII